MSITLDRFYHTPSRLYLVISRLRSDGGLIPIFRSKVLNKKKHANASPSGTTPVPEEANDEDKKTGFLFRGIRLSNQLLLNGKPDSRMVITAWNFNSSRRDEYVGHTIIECRKFAVMKETERYELVYDSDEMRALQQNGVKVVEANDKKMREFAELVNNQINSVSASSLTLRTLDDLKNVKEQPDANILLCDEFFDLGNEYAMGMRWARSVGVRRRTRAGVVKVSDVQSMYKNSFFDYKNCTDMDFIVVVTDPVKRRSAST